MAFLKPNVSCLHPALSAQESSEAGPSAPRLLRDATLIHFPQRGVSVVSHLSLIHHRKWML